MDLSNKTVAELNLMSKAQLIGALTEDRRETRTTVSTGDKRGQLKEVRETRDINNKLISTQEVLWTYYPNGCVNIITIIERDSKGMETSREIIKHTEGGGLAIMTAKVIGGI